MMTDFEADRRAGYRAVYGVAAQAIANFKNTQYSVTYYALLLFVALVALRKQYFTSVAAVWSRARAGRDRASGLDVAQRRRTAPGHRLQPLRTLRVAGVRLPKV